MEMPMTAIRTNEAEDLPDAPTRLDRLGVASALAAELAHEIATPLTALMGALDGLEQRVRELRRRGSLGTFVADLWEDLELATASSSAITDLVHDFQAFLREEGGQSAPTADVGQAVRRAIRLMSARQPVAARVDLQLHDVPAVRAPMSRVVQVILNLLLNATEALAAHQRPENMVRVRVETRYARVLVEVSHNGPGLSASVLDGLRDARASDEPGRASMGLGLAISRELVRKMNGELSVASAPGAGMTFTVSLPAAP
jgi:signal transduction histidine kinase